MTSFDYSRRNFCNLSAVAIIGLAHPLNVFGQDNYQITEDVYNVTLDQLADENSELFSAAHTLVMFSVDESASGWRCEPCQHMRPYFSWRAQQSSHRGVEPTQLRYVLVEVNSNTFNEPEFLTDAIVGWPTIVHLTNDQDTEIYEDRVRGLDIQGLRQLVEKIEASYQ